MEPSSTFDYERYMSRKLWEPIKSDQFINGNLAYINEKLHGAYRERPLCICYKEPTGISYWSPINEEWVNTVTTKSCGYNQVYHMLLLVVKNQLFVKFHTWWDLLKKKVETLKWPRKRIYKDEIVLVERTVSLKLA